MPEELKASIHATLEILPLLPDIDKARLEFQALLLEYEISAAANPESKQSTATQAANELEILHNALEDLKQAVEELSPRALVALNTAQEPLHAKRRAKSRLLPGPTSEDTLGFFGKPQILVSGNFLPSNCGHVLRIAKRAALDLRTSAQPERGRNPNLAARALALTLAEVFYKLTGQRPTMRTDWETAKGYGPFFEFVKACFKLAGLNAAPERYVRFAAENFDKSMDVIERD